MSKNDKNSSLVENAIKEKELESIITFGKYKGKTVHEILHLDPSYLVWAHTNIEWFKLSDGVYSEAVDGAYQAKMRYFVENFDWGVDPYDYMD